MKSSWSWIILGVFLILGGFYTLMNLPAASLVVGMLAGWVFLFGGAFLLFAAFMSKEDTTSSRVWTGIWSLMLLIAGFSIISEPFKGVITLTLLLGIVFMVSGITRLVLSFSMGGGAMFWLMLLTGIASVIIGFFVMTNTMQAATSLLGLLLAIELLSDGMGSIAYGMTLRKVKEDI